MYRIFISNVITLKKKGNLYFKLVDYIISFAK